MVDRIVAVIDIHGGGTTLVVPTRWTQVLQAAGIPLWSHDLVTVFQNNSPIRTNAAVVAFSLKDCVATVQLADQIALINDSAAERAGAAASALAHINLAGRNRRTIDDGRGPVWITVERR